MDRLRFWGLVLPRRVCLSVIVGVPVGLFVMGAGAVMGLAAPFYLMWRGINQDLYQPDHPGGILSQLRRILSRGGVA